MRHLLRESPPHDRRILPLSSSGQRKDPISVTMNTASHYHISSLDLAEPSCPHHLLQGYISPEKSQSNVKLSLRIVIRIYGRLNGNTPFSHQTSRQFPKKMQRQGRKLTRCAYHRMKAIENQSLCPQEARKALTHAVGVVTGGPV